MEFRTFQANASRYTEYIIAATSNNCTGFLKKKLVVTGTGAT